MHSISIAANPTMILRIAALAVFGITSGLHGQDAPESTLPESVVTSLPSTSGGSAPSPLSRTRRPLTKPESSAGAPIVIDDESPEADLDGDWFFPLDPGGFDMPPLEEPRDLLRYVPNQSVSDSGARGFGEIYTVRGLTNTTFFGAPATTLYVDDIPFGETFTFSTETGPIGSIDVLAGPQPTRVGRNVYGGLIDLKTRRPTQEIEGGLEYEVGSYDSHRLEGWLMGLFPEDAGSFRIRTSYDERDGYLFNPTLGKRVDIQESQMVDGALYLNIAPDWELGFIAGGGRQDDGAIRVTSLDRTSGFYTVTSNVAGEQIREIDHQALRIAHDGDRVKFLSVTSRRDYRILPSTNDFDFMASPLSTTTLSQSQQVWSQEFRFSDNDPDAEWGWNAGLYGSTSEICGSVRRGFTRFNSRIDRTVKNIIQPVPFMPFGIPLTVRSTSLSDTRIDVDQLTTHTLDEETFAVYGGVEYRGLDSVTLKAGTRLDRNERSIVRDRSQTGQAVTETVTTSTIDPFLGFPVPALPLDVRSTITPLDSRQGRIEMQEEWVHFTPTTGIDWEVTDRITAFAKTSYAFKPGGFSPYTDDTNFVAFDEEKSLASEGGVRSRSNDGKTVANLLFFYSNVEDYQIERNITPTEYTVFNADEAEIYGAEFEIAHALTSTLDLSASFGYTHARLTAYLDPSTGQNLAGFTPPYVPEFDAVVALDYHLDNGFFSRFEVLGVGNTNYDDLNRPEFQQEAYALLNATIGCRKGGRTTAVYGSNLAGNEYYTTMSPQFRTGGIGLPREFGVRVEVEF